MIEYEVVAVGKLREIPAESRNEELQRFCLLSMSAGARPPHFDRVKSRPSIRMADDMTVPQLLSPKPQGEVSGIGTRKIGRFQRHATGFTTSDGQLPRALPKSEDERIVRPAAWSWIEDASDRRRVVPDSDVREDFVMDEFRRWFGGF